MMVQALVSFVARINGNAMTIPAGQVIAMPDGADWLAAGLVAPVPEPEIETAVLAPDVETATVPRRRTGRGQNAT